MNQSNQSSDNTFVELGSATIPKQTAVRSGSNIFKNIQANSVQFNSFTDKSKNDCEPIVNIHKDGDKIECIEFVCSCGNTKLLKFDYDVE
jgi:hypothetical protein